jgi:hypothetical protein
MINRTPRTLLATAAVSLAAGAALAPAALARHGADDPAGHDRFDDNGGRAALVHTARHGADDVVRHRHRHHDRGVRRHGNDDGPNHS